MGKGNFEGGEGRPVVKYMGTPCGRLRKMTEPIEMSFGLRTSMGLGNHLLDWSPDAPSEGAVLEKEELIVSIGTFCRELCKNG